MLSRLTKFLSFAQPQKHTTSTFNLFGTTRNFGTFTNNTTGNAIYKNYKKFKLPSGNTKEIDHILPFNVMAPGQNRSKGEGKKIHDTLPAIPLDKGQHRRKNTTGNSKWARQHREYLRQARKGRIPFAGRMESQEDFFTAAAAIDLKSTFTGRTLFAELDGKDSNEPRIPPKSRKTVKRQDAEASLMEAYRLPDTYKNKGYIGDYGNEYLRKVVSDMHEELEREYNMRSL